MSSVGGAPRLTDSFNRLVTVLVLIAVDLLGYYISLIVSFGLRGFADNYLHWSMHNTFSLDHFLSMQIPPLIIIGITAYQGLYSKRLAFWDETLTIIKMIGFAGLGITTIVAMGKLSDQLSRLHLVFMGGVMVFVMPLARLVGKRFMYHLGMWNEKIAIAGAGMAGRDFAQGISRERHMGYSVIGFFDDDPQKKGTEIEIPGVDPIPVIGPLSSCPEVVVEKGLETVAIAIPSLDLERQAELVNFFQKYTRHLLFVPEIRGVAIANTNLYYLFDEELFIFDINNKLRSSTNQWLKVVFDYIVTLLAMPIFGMALLLFSLAIRLDSPGPVIFSQRRLGKDGREFQCYKFRTMFLNNEEILEECLKDEEKCSQWQEFKKIKGKDPRITRVGRFLRKTSLDELPQLFNILKGEMSLVGPRPYLPHELEEMQGMEGVILEAKPGLTGLWQVSGRNRLSFAKRLRLDMWYVRNWSLWIDIVMILKTIKVVVRGDGAH